MPTPTLTISQPVDSSGYAAEIERLNAYINSYLIGLNGRPLNSRITKSIAASRERIAELQAGLGGVTSGSPLSRPGTAGADPIFAGARLDLGRVAVSDLKSPYIGR